MKCSNPLQLLLIPLTALLLSSAGCTPLPDFQAQFKPLVDTYINAWNDGNLDALDAIIHPDFKRHSDVATTLKGIADLRVMIAGFRASNPGVQLVSNDEIYSENRFAGRWTLVGGNAEKQLWGINIIRFQDGKIIEEWDAFDNLQFKASRGYGITTP